MFQIPAIKDGGNNAVTIFKKADQITAEKPFRFLAEPVYPFQTAGLHPDRGPGNSAGNKFIGPTDSNRQMPLLYIP